jgi:hypothetical protein
MNEPQSTAIRSLLSILEPAAIIGLKMRADAEPKPLRRRNESPCRTSVARSVAWVGPFHRTETRRHDANKGPAALTTASPRKSDQTCGVSYGRTARL